jgi:hypothetical protein
VKRGDFFKEMGSSLFQTVKTVYEPFIHDDLEKIEGAADKVLGIHWVPVMQEYDNEELEMKFVGGKPIIVSRDGTNMWAVDGVCPVCSNIITLRTLYSSGKCLNCEKEFNFKTQTGDLKLEFLPVKQKDKTFFVGLRERRN